MRLKSTITEPTLRRFVQGHPGAFRLIFDAYYARILAYSQKIAKSSTEAEEISQLVFIRLWEKRHLVDTKRPLEPYLYKITRNCAFDHLQKKAYYAQQQQQASEHYLMASHCTEEDVSYAECRRLTDEVIDALPEKRQIIFKMHFEEGHSPTEIANLLDISPATVKSQLVKATKTVKSFLSNLLVNEWVWWPVVLFFL